MNFSITNNQHTYYYYYLFFYKLQIKKNQLLIFQKAAQIVTKTETIEICVIIEINRAQAKNQILLDTKKRNNKFSFVKSQTKF